MADAASKLRRCQWEALDFILRFRAMAMIVQALIAHMAERKRSQTCIVRTVTSRKGRKAGHQREHSVADTVCSQILYLRYFRFAFAKGKSMIK